MGSFFGMAAGDQPGRATLGEKGPLLVACARGPALVAQLVWLLPLLARDNQLELYACPLRRLSQNLAHHNHPPWRDYYHWCS